MTIVPLFSYTIPGSIIYHFIFSSLNTTPKNITISLGALICPYSYIYCTLSRDGALHIQNTLVLKYFFIIFFQKQRFYIIINIISELVFNYKFLKLFGKKGSFSSISSSKLYILDLSLSKSNSLISSSFSLFISYLFEFFYFVHLEIFYVQDI